MSVTMHVTYSGSVETRFDRDYWLNEHFRLVRETWTPHGLQTIAGFFPAGDGGGIVAICPCVFRDEDALRGALSDPRSKEVMADVRKFTDLEPQQSLAGSLAL